jgi:hypothetical protein
LDEFGAGHADAEILDRDRLGLVVGCDIDLQGKLVVEDLLFRELGVPEFSSASDALETSSRMKISFSV